MSEDVISNNQINEQLSALMDGELARDQVRFLLRGVEAQSDLARRWSSYHLISATLKREFIVPLPVNFSDGVIGRLQAEVQSDAVAAVNVRRGAGALRWVGGGAIAAAVAVVALVVSRPVGNNAAPAGTLDRAVVQQVRHARQAYPPLLAQPSIASPLPMAGYNPNDVLPASFESVLPNYYSPRGDALSRQDLSAAAVPYVLYVAPAQRPSDAAAAASQPVATPH
jgi:sigma-E factor negative regulatory protein RseA